MCNLCGGTHVVTNQIGPMIFKQPCPKCGPMPKAEYLKKKEAFRKRLREAQRLAEKDAS